MLQPATICQFLTGFVIGTLLGIFTLSYLQNFTLHVPEMRRGHLRTSRDDTASRGVFMMDGHWLPTQDIPDDVKHTQDLEMKVRSDESVERELARRIQVTCLVQLSGNLDSMLHFAKITKDTWGKRCSNLLFYRFMSLSNTLESSTMSQFKAANLTQIVINPASLKTNITQDKNTKLTRYNMAALQHALSKYPDTDWFIQTKTATYVIMENLRFFLFDKTSKEPVIFGDNTNKIPQVLAMEAGIVFSKEAVKRLEKGIMQEECKGTRNKTYTEVLVDCIQSMRGKVIQPFDNEDRNLFHSFHPRMYFTATEWSSKQQLLDIYRGNVTKDRNLPSRFPVSFCGSNTLMLLEMEYFLYHYQTHGVYDSYAFVKHV